MQGSRCEVGKLKLSLGIPVWEDDAGRGAATSTYVGNNSAMNLGFISLTSICSLKLDP